MKHLTHHHLYYNPTLLTTFQSPQISRLCTSSVTCLWRIFDIYISSLPIAIIDPHSAKKIFLFLNIYFVLKFLLNLAPTFDCLNRQLE